MSVRHILSSERLNEGLRSYEGLTSISFWLVSISFLGISHLIHFGAFKRLILYPIDYKP